MIKEQVQSFIEKYNLSGTFLVAFSGGYDSMCLLDVLIKLNQDVIAIHLNHNWRGEESDKEEKNCEKFAKLKGIKFYSEKLSADITKNETAARNARYEFFKRCAEKFNSNVVFTAHNFDDNAETVLYRIIKGTGTFGLQGISEKREIFYRPLLNTKRQDIEKYCLDNNLTPNNDSSNLNTKYKRNLIRHKILPLMKEINPKVNEALNSLSQIAKEDSEILSKSSKIKIRNLLIENNIDYDKEKIENIQYFIDKNKNSKSGKKMSLSSNIWLFVNQNGIEIISNQPKYQNEISVTKEGQYNFNGKILSIKPCTVLPKEFPKDDEFIAYVNFEKIDFSIRHRKDGDKIQPLGFDGTQKLKKYLNEKKIPQHKKDEIILLCKGSEVLWVAGFGINDKIKVASKPTHVIELLT